MVPHWLGMDMQHIDPQNLLRPAFALRKSFFKKEYLESIRVNLLRQLLQCLDKNISDDR